MTNFKEQIISILETIEGGSAFYCSGSNDQIYSGMCIDGYGEVEFPFTASTFEKILPYTKQAPFGKGSETITDTSVRSTLEINAKKIHFKNPKWEKQIDKTLTSVKKKLGIEKKSICASLYKLLIYKEGDFFLPHKDSEKEKGMFGTLLIGLPAKHTGGEFIIRFKEQEESILFSDKIDQYEMPYIAFFSDCEHEVKKVTSGFRVCLAYNLIQLDKTLPIKSSSFNDQTNQLTALLNNCSDNFSNKPLAILLDHQYTPANFSYDFLKRSDAPKAEMILKATEKAGYYGQLGLVTSYLMGDLEDDGDYDYYGNRYSSSGEDGTMGEEIYEDSIEIQHWVKGVTPDLGTISIEEDDIITNTVLNDGDPTEKEEEGFTGNAGMTIEYWYHYGAVIIWPKDKHVDLISNQDIDTKLKWIVYYLENWDTNLTQQEKQDAKKLLEGFEITEREAQSLKYHEIDCSPIALLMLKLGNIHFRENNSHFKLISTTFRFITIDHWISLLKTYPSLFNVLFFTIGKSQNIADLNHLLLLLEKVSKVLPIMFDEKGRRQLQMLPKYLDFEDIYKAEHQKLVKNILNNILFLSTYNNEKTWAETLLNSMTKSPKRNYVNKVLVAVLLSDTIHKKSNFSINLYNFCLKDLEKRTEIKPTPPKNWTRNVPNSSYYSSKWSILKGFLNSPTLQVFDYKELKANRLEMEQAIKNVVIDLKFETIRKKESIKLKNIYLLIT